MRDTSTDSGCAPHAGRMVAASCRARREPPLVARLSLGILTAIVLAGCSTGGESTFTVFADPGKYQYYSCDQIGAQIKQWSTRQQELQTLMDKADQNAGGMIVNLLAYRADHVAATEELKVLTATARSKNCDTPANWRSNTVIR